MLAQKRRIKLPHVDAWCPGPVECLRFFARPLAVWNVSIPMQAADFEDDSDGNRRIRSAPPLSLCPPRTKVPLLPKVSKILILLPSPIYLFHIPLDRFVSNYFEYFEIFDRENEIFLSLLTRCFWNFESLWIFVSSKHFFYYDLEYLVDLELS